MAKAKEKKDSKSKTQIYKNYIGGEWVKSASGEYFDNVNPADTNDVVGRFPKSTAEDVDRAVEAAKNAATKWRRTPAPKRAELLFKLGEILRDNKEQFTREMTREMGKVLKEAGGDVQEAIDCTYYTAGEGRRLHGFTTKAEMPNKYAMCERQPVGLCGLITPFNFPMAIPSLETYSRARLRKYGRDEIRRRRAAFNDQSRQSVRKSRNSERRDQRRQRFFRTGRSTCQPR